MRVSSLGKMPVFRYLWHKRQKQNFISVTYQLFTGFVSVRRYHCFRITRVIDAECICCVQPGAEWLDRALAPLISEAGLRSQGSGHGTCRGCSNSDKLGLSCRLSANFAPYLVVNQAVDRLQMCHVVRPRDEQENDRCCVFVVGMGSSVGMATCCGVVGPGIESRGGGGERNFPYPSQTDRGAHTAYWVPDLFRVGDHPPPSSVGVK